MSAKRPARGSATGALAAALVAVPLLAAGCGTGERGVPVPGREGATKTAAVERAARRLYDGAPPVIAHPSFGAACISCHDAEGRAVPGVGYAPPSPHELTLGMSATSSCRQCHVFQQTSEPWRGSTFAGLRQDLRSGRRLGPHAPPVIPHRVLMRENCLACHAGPAAREEIRTTHPERAHCRQCHLEQTTVAVFAPAAS